MRAGSPPSSSPSCGSASASTAWSPSSCTSSPPPSATAASASTRAPPRRSFVVGYLGEEVDWHLGFGAAAVGMALGLLQYVLGGRRLAAQLREEPVVRLTPAERSRMLRSGAYSLAFTGALVALLAAVHALSVDSVTFVLTLVAVVVPGGVLVSMYRSPKVTPVERTRLRAYMWLFLAATLFWLVYDQMGNELNVFAAQKTDLSLLGWHIPASWTQSLPALFVIVLAPVFASCRLKHLTGESAPFAPTPTPIPTTA
ncbi:hypothetical protein ACIQUQ_29690 [Streptomyces sp. NPDC101118]|uniref:POT-type proton-dependent oligopeptide transporter n=1 Tax=Streptomyces sp. NPDC101118 TaxID=3366109 RepID=UPI003811E5AF